MNIKDNLLHMKDITELMLDLAYSAVFLKDKAIAEKVKEMHKEVAMLEDSTLKMLFKVREPEEDRMFIVDLTDSMKDIANAALHIAELSDVKGKPSIVKDMLREGTERVISVEISSKSEYANKTISESQIRTNTRCNIIGIKRKGEWIFSIDKETKLLPKDEVIAVGTHNADRNFKKKSSG
ncbi:potassium channel family protein [candidate division KSB1 bacterium]